MSASSSLAPSLSNVQEAAVRLLLVDNSPAVLALLGIAVDESTLDAEVDTASSLTEARAKLDRARALGVDHLPDLVMLDPDLPDGSGLDLLSMVEHDPRLSHIPVVIFSSSRKPLEYARRLRSGAVRHLVKPLPWEALVEAMSDLSDLLSLDGLTRPSGATLSQSAPA